MLFKKQARFYFLLLLVCSISFTTFSQNSSIKGKVFEKAIPLEFATVSLYNKTDSNKSIKNTISDSTGSFIFENLATGNYVLKINLIGYLSNQLTVELISDHAIADAGNIFLTIDAQQLKAVTVTAQKALIQKTSQGFIINASANLTQMGGTATDLLRSTPTVQVDAEGMITIRGKSPLILINGRNSGISNTNQIAASSIESIEIINNPSAQYDADAEGGIINIKLKKNKQKGSNASIVLGAGMGAKGRVNSAVLLNHKTAKFNYALGYDNRFAGRTRTINAERVNFDLPDEYYFTQHRDDDRLDQIQNLRFNIDFTPNSKNTWGFEAIGNMEGQDNYEDLTTTVETKENNFSSKYNRYSEEIGREKVAEFALNYSRQFTDIRKQLSASVSTSFNKENENTDITSQALEEDNTLTGEPYYQRTYNYENSNVSNIIVNYTQPLSAKATIETGYKGILRFLDADFQSLNKINGDYIPNPLASNIFNFNEQVHAAYVQYSAFAGDKTNPRFKYNMGLRAEQVWNDGVAKSNNVSFNNNYFNWFPSANLSYYKAAEEFWKLSYSRRINRPGLGQLNPFIDITDSLNQSGGNPYLQPELVHSMELGYNKEWQKLSLYTTLYYRYASNSIRGYTVIDSNGVALTKPANFGNIITYGLENIITAKPFSVYDFMLSFSLYQQNIDGSNVAYETVNNLFSWTVKLINNFVCWPGSKLQVIGAYTAPVATPQGKRIAVYNVDMGFQQKIGKGNTRLGLVVTDIFNTQQSGQIINGANFTNNRVSKVDSRAILLTVAFSFGTSVKEKMMENKFSND